MQHQANRAAKGLHEQRIDNVAAVVPCFGEQDVLPDQLNILILLLPRAQSLDLGFAWSVL